MLQAQLDSPEPARSVEDGVARARALFDDSVSRHEEASVALYSLGNPSLLAAATDEAVAVLENWGVLQAGRDAFELGCGIGRFLPPLAARLRSVVGTDVSRHMVDVAARRLESSPNVSVRWTAGKDLSEFADASFDLVLSVDAFPYIVLSGFALVESCARAVTSYCSIMRMAARAPPTTWRFALWRTRPDSASFAPMKRPFAFGTASGGT
jgi:SAM-dependent methyltransferase